jgi:hypothetical protein
MKRLLIFIMVMLLAGCNLTESEDDVVFGAPCVSVDDVDFYASTKTTTLGTKDVIMLETNFGDIEIDNDIYINTELNVYSHLCINTEDAVAVSFKSARLLDINVPEPPTVYVDVPVIEYVDKEVIVTEYVDVEVEVVVEVPVYTHDLIDPDVWVAMDHAVYYYQVQEGIVHLVYTKADYAFELKEMFILTIIFDENLVFSDQVMIASMTQYVMGIFNGAVGIDADYVDTEFATMTEYIENFIVSHTYQDIVDMYIGGTAYGTE